MTSAAANLLNTDPLVELLDEQLRRVLEETPCAVPAELWERSLYEPLREFLARPRKGLRAYFVEAGWRLGGGRGAPPIELPMIVEVLHAGSLIIDDIEDDSKTRRSGRTLHQLHGTPLAINAGNWLYFWAMALLERVPGDAAMRVDLYRLTTETFLACHHGQAMDIALHVGTLERAHIPEVVRAISLLKTGALVQYALALGARAAGARPERIAALTRFGAELGLLIQMLDDLGGLTRQERRVKGHEDLLNGRATWPWAWAAATSDEGRYAALRQLGAEVHARETHQELLGEALREAIGDHGRQAVRAQIARAVEVLESSFEERSVVNELAGEIRSLEVVYA